MNEYTVIINSVETEFYSAPYNSPHKYTIMYKVLSPEHTPRDIVESQQTFTTLLIMM